MFVKAIAAFKSSSRMHSNQLGLRVITSNYCVGSQNFRPKLFYPYIFISIKVVSQSVNYMFWLPSSKCFEINTHFVCCRSENISILCNREFSCV